MQTLNFKIRPGAIIDKNSLNLTALQQLTLTFTGSASLGMMQPEGYSEPVEIYIVHCPEHGYFLDLKHGYEPSYFSCGKCSAKTKRLWAKVSVKATESKTHFSILQSSPKFVESPCSLRPTNTINQPITESQ